MPKPLKVGDRVKVNEWAPDSTNVGKSGTVVAVNNPHVIATVKFQDVPEPVEYDERELKKVR